MHTILAGIDPIALDYCGAKHFIYPLSENRAHHDPDYSQSAISKFLAQAHFVLGEGALDEQNVQILRYDFKRFGGA